MRLRNKKTGKFGEYKVISAGFLIRVKDCNSDESWQYDCLAGFIEDWEDYKEPLIKDKEYRKRIKQLAKLLGVEPDDSVWVDTSDSNIKLEFRISFMCTYYLKFCAYTTDLCIKTDYYTLAELCGEEEEPEDDEDEEDLRAEEY